MLEDHRLIAQEKYEFQHRKVPQLALLKTKDRIIDKIENKLYTIRIFLDSTKVLDFIKHDVLLGKLFKHGVRGCALGLIRSCLSGRLPHAVMADVTSDLCEISYGVPMESIPRPLF